MTQGTTGFKDIEGYNVDTISEKTAGAGVTVDGLNIKDGKVTIFETYSNQVNASQYTPGANSFSNVDIIQYTIPATGNYRITAQAQMQSISSSATSLIVKNSTTLSYAFTGPAERYHHHTHSPWRGDLTVGDVIYLRCSCSGGSWAYIDGNDVGGAVGSTRMLVERMS